MADATFAITNFLGGEISQFAQGGFDKPSYKNSLNVCLNSFPVEIGPWVRRPGTQFAGTTRSGNPGRVISWAFEQTNPITLEFTDGYLRFRNGVSWLTTNNTQAVTALSSADPAVATVAAAPETGTTGYFGGLGTSCPLLQNRQFTVTNLTGTTFSIADALTGANIDGSTLGVLPAGATFSVIQEVTTPYLGSSWSTVRMVQAETTGILLNGAYAPQALTVLALASGSNNATFTLAPATFDDGPYLDPFTNGAQVTPNQTTGVVALTLSFPSYVATKSYGIGDFVTSSSVNYESLVDQNVGNTPVSSPSEWAPVNASAAINPPSTQPNGTGRGFLQTDIGRLIRLFSEPALWLIGSTYSAGEVVSYNPTDQPGASTYWQSLTSSNTGKIPGSDLTNWEVVAPGAALPSLPDGTQSVNAGSGPAQWTWGKIVSLLNFIPGSPSGIAHVGNMTAGGGVAAAFDGTTDQNAAVSAGLSGNFSAQFPNSVSLIGYVGQNYSGASPASYAMQSATVFPSSDKGFAVLTNNVGAPVFSINITAAVYSSNSPPVSPTNGILQGTAIAVSNGVQSTTSAIWGTTPVTIIVADQTTAYAYWWVVLTVSVTIDLSQSQFTISSSIAQVEFINAAGTGASANGINVELIGPPLLYTTAIRTWQLGAYSNTTGWPTCGCYADGRLWLSGAIPNRFDACTSNGINGSEINFAPTDQYGTVSDSSGISYTLNSDSVNPIYWLVADLQGILIGTQQREWLLFAPGQGGITPTNIDSRPAGRHGCANVEPRPTEHTYIFVQRFSIKLMEFFADIFSGKFTAPNLADKAQPIVRTGIAEIAYTYAAEPMIWGRCNDGSLFGVAYKRDTLMTAQGPTYYAWHRHKLGSGRITQSLTAGPSVGGNLDALTMVTNQATATDPQYNVYHVEVLTDTTDELTPIAQCWFLDDAVVPSSTVSTNTGGAGYGGITLNGLWHLNGETVAVSCGGLDCGNYTVASGSIFVPYGDSISAGTGGGLFTAAIAAANQIVVGFTYNSDGQLVRPQMPQETGARNGPALGKRRRTQKVAILLNNLGMSNNRNQSALAVGRDFSNLMPIIISPQVVPNQMQLSPGQTFSGVWKDTVQFESNYDNRLCWRVSRPLPANVIAIEPMLHTQDE
jgi:hypothetical protein